MKSDSDIENNKLSNLDLNDLSSFDKKVLNRIFSDDLSQTDIEMLNIESLEKDSYSNLKVPPPLHQKLYKITDNKPYYRKTWLSFATAAVIAGIIFYNIFLIKPIPSNSDILKARNDLALAFYYLEKTNNKANKATWRTIDDKLNRATKPVIKHLSDYSLQ